MSNPGVGESPGSPRRRYTASLEDAGPSPKKPSTKGASNKDVSSAKPNLEDNNSRTPKVNDVYFGKAKCVGTKHLKTIVKRELKSNPNLEFSPTVLKTIHQRLDGRKFFIPDQSGDWREASRNECRSEISKVFHMERSKLQSKGRTKDEEE